MRYPMGERVTGTSCRRDQFERIIDYQDHRGDRPAYRDLDGEHSYRLTFRIRLRLGPQVTVEWHPDTEHDRDIRICLARLRNVDQSGRSTRELPRVGEKVKAVN